MTTELPLQKANQLLQSGQWQQALQSYLPLLWYQPALFQAVHTGVQLAATQIPVSAEALQLTEPTASQATTMADHWPGAGSWHTAIASWLPKGPASTSDQPSARLCCSPAALQQLCNWVAQHPCRFLLVQGDNPWLLLAGCLHQWCWQSQVWWHLTGSAASSAALSAQSWPLPENWFVTSDDPYAYAALQARYLTKRPDPLFAGCLQHAQTVPVRPTEALLQQLPKYFNCALGAPRLLPAWLPEPLQPAPQPAQTQTELQQPAGYRLALDSVTATEVRGWAVAHGQPDAVFELELLINQQPFSVTRNDRTRNDLLRQGLSAGLGGFAFRLPATLPAGEHQLQLRLPDASLSEVHTLSLPAGPHTLPYHLLQPASRARTAVTIIVPVFNAAADVQRCLQSLQQWTAGKARLLLIDDASTDAAIAPLLAQAAGWPNTTVLCNERNLGFTATVNRGMAWAGSDDVVLLNSDARVTPGWLSLLQQAAYSGEDIATVTPFSDRAGAFSAPVIGNENPLPYGVSEAEFACAVQRSAGYLYPVVPTGNGFCLYIKRRCLDAIGALDVAAFPRGYGEENDFCMRAQRAGWRNIIADNCYVFHQRSQSFGEEKHALMQAGRAVIDERYPEYGLAIRVFREQPALALARFHVHQASQLALQPVKPRFLFVVATQTGGTPQTNQDLMQALSDDMDCWLLRCDSQQLWLWQYQQGALELRAEHQLGQGVDAITHRSADYDQTLASWLQFFRFNLVHIRHLAWHSLSLPALAKASGAAVVMSLHDYYSLCPTVQLLDEQQRYCGGSCTASKGDCKQSLWPANSLPALKHGWVHQWRLQFDQALADCDAFITTSDSAKATLQAGLSTLSRKPFYVIAHGRDFKNFYQLAAPLQPGEPLRIVLPGNITESKGLLLVQQLLAQDSEGVLEFHILGQHKFSSPDPRLVLHGAYQRDDFASHIERIQPHLGAIWSVWNETWCHTLTELWACGVPVSVLDYPTVAGRVQQSGAGWVMPGEPAALCASLYALLKQPDDLVAKARASQRWQQQQGCYNHTAMMAAAYQAVYQTALRRSWQQQACFVPPANQAVVDAEVPKPLALVCPALDRRHANPSTHIRLWQHSAFQPTAEQVVVRLSANELLAAVQDGQVTRAVIQRQAIPAELWPAIKAQVQQGKLQYQLDLDDNLLEVPASKDPAGFYQGYRPVLLELLQLASVITVASEGLQQQLTALGYASELVPNCLSPRLWRQQAEQHPAAGSKSVSKRLLYMGTPSHDDDFELVRPALEQVAAMDADFRLVVVGVFGQQTAVPAWVERIEIPPEAGHYPDFVRWLLQLPHGCSAAIAPLQDTGFNQAKSPLKLLDYAALGLPVLASDSPVYQALAAQAPAVTLVANNNSAWFHAVCQLLSQLASQPANNPDSLAGLGKRMRDWVYATHVRTQTCLLQNENDKAGSIQ